MTSAILINGLVLGSLYAIVALGYTMVYGIIELINFAHGDVFTFGVFISTGVIAKIIDQNSFAPPTAAQSIESIALAMVLAVVACAVLGFVIERIAYRPLRRAPRLAPLITAIAVSLILENAFSEYWGGQLIFYPTTIAERTFWPFGMVSRHDALAKHPAWYITWIHPSITNIALLVIVGGLLMMVTLDLFVNRTKIGKAMRAVAQDREAAMMMGIDVDRIISVTFIVGSGLAGAGAVLYGVDVGSVSYNTGFSLGLFAFTAAVLGGIGNIRGAFLGGMLIGIITAYVDSLGSGLGTQWSTVVIFSVLILVLVFRPAGLLGSATTDKV